MLYSFALSVLCILCHYVSAETFDVLPLVQADRRLALDAKLQASCDDEAILERSDDGGNNYVTVADKNTFRGWSTVHIFNLNAVTKRTVIKIKCINSGGGPGGLLGEVTVAGITYPTESGGLWRVGKVAATNAGYTLQYVAKDGAGWPAGTGSAYSSNAKWMWVPSGDALNFYFRFRRVFAQLPYQDELDAKYPGIEWDEDEGDLEQDATKGLSLDASLQASCDDEAILERSDDRGKTYVTVADKNSFRGWSTVHTFRLSGVIKRTVIKIKCINSGGGPGGLLADMSVVGITYPTESGGLWRVGKVAAANAGYTLQYVAKDGAGWPAGTGSAYSSNAKWMWVPSGDALNFYFRFRRVFAQLPYQDEMDAEYPGIDWEEDLSDEEFEKESSTNLMHIINDLQFEELSVQQLATTAAIPIALLASGLLCYHCLSGKKQGEYKSLVDAPTNV